MLNMFINANQNGGFGGTFVIDAPELGSGRLTPKENLNLISIDITTNLAGNNLSVAKSRVNALGVLVRELETIVKMKKKEIVTCYLPQVLLSELNTGRVKYYIADDSNTNSFFSTEEIDLWKKALPLINKLYMNLVFKDINSCKPSTKYDASTKVQYRRGVIYNQILQKIKIQEENKDVFSA